MCSERDRVYCLQAQGIESCGDVMLSAKIEPDKRDEGQGYPLMGRGITCNILAIRETVYEVHDICTARLLVSYGM